MPIKTIETDTIRVIFAIPLTWTVRCKLPAHDPILQLLTLFRLRSHVHDWLFEKCAQYSHRARARSKEEPASDKASSSGDDSDYEDNEHLDLQPERSPFSKPSRGSPGITNLHKSSQMIAPTAQMVPLRPDTQLPSGFRDVQLSDPTDIIQVVNNRGHSRTVNLAPSSSALSIKRPSDSIQCQLFTLDGCLPSERSVRSSTEPTSRKHQRTESSKYTSNNKTARLFEESAPSDTVSRTTPVPKDIPHYPLTTEATERRSLAAEPVLHPKSSNAHKKFGTSSPRSSKCTNDLGGEGTESLLQPNTTGTHQGHFQELAAADDLSIFELDRSSRAERSDLEYSGRLGDMASGEARICDPKAVQPSCEASPLLRGHYCQAPLDTADHIVITVLDKSAPQHQAGTKAESPTSRLDPTLDRNEGGGKELARPTATSRPASDENRESHQNESLPPVYNASTEAVSSQNTLFGQQSVRLPASAETENCNDSRNEISTEACAQVEPEERPTALERARVSVSWEAETDCPDFISLKRCISYENLFTQLERRLPARHAGRKIGAAEIRLTNASAAGIEESPNCRILRDDGEDAFEHLTEVLNEYTPQVRPKLKLMVEFWE